MTFTLLLAQNCQLCQQSLRLAKEIYQTDKKSPLFQQALYEMCKGNAKCKKLVGANLETFQVYFKHDYPIEPLCEIMDMCPAARISAANSCQLCDQILVKLHQMQGYSSKPNYRRFVSQQICDIMPDSNSKGVCKSIMRNGIAPDQIEQLPNKQVCMLQNQCPGEVHLRDKCKLCNYMARWRGNKDIMQKVCNLVQPSDRKQCEDVQRTYGKDILKFGEQACAVSVCTEL